MSKIKIIDIIGFVVDSPSWANIGNLWALNITNENAILEVI